MASHHIFSSFGRRNSLFNHHRFNSDMEREQYQNQISDLLQAVETLLKSNDTMGEELRRVTVAYEDLKAKYEKLKGELAMSKRGG